MTLRLELCEDGLSKSSQRSSLLLRLWQCIFHGQEFRPNCAPHRFHQILFWAIVQIISIRFSERNPPKKSRFWDELNFVQFEKLAFSKRYCYLKTDFSKSLERSRTQFLKSEGRMEHPRQNYGSFFIAP